MPRPQFTLKTQGAIVAIGSAALLAAWWADESGFLDAHLEAILGVSSLVSVGILAWFIVWWRRHV